MLKLALEWRIRNRAMALEVTIIATSMDCLTNVSKFAGLATNSSKKNMIIRIPTIRDDRERINVLTGAKTPINPTTTAPDEM